MKNFSRIVLVVIACLSANAYAAGSGTPAEPVKKCAPADLDARTLARIADELDKLKDQVSPNTRIGENLSGVFSPIALIEALQDEFNIVLTEEEEERILNGTVKTAQEIVRAKHRKNVPPNSCHRDGYDFDL
ncbi:hypothetical protein [Pseudoduganella sp. GCM10020061]|uniref:hypothetical protein n=1 Tax=Pseudoduganella sp. GCM10020061 TaxID=3317345 RepID=UPI0036408374